MDKYDILDMLSEFDLESGEFYSIMRDSEFFQDMDPFEMMVASDILASESGQTFFGEEEGSSDDEEMGSFQMAALSEVLGDLLRNVMN